MAKYVRNDTGTLHSVDDGFTVPEGWEEVNEATARAEAPDLLGDAPAPVEEPAPAEEAGTTE
jgi:hypothetical protein